MSNYNEIVGIHRTTLLVIAIAICFDSFSVHKALGVGQAERSEVPAVAASVSGTALAAGVDVTVTNTNPLSTTRDRTNPGRRSSPRRITEA